MAERRPGSKILDALEPVDVETRHAETWHVENTELQ